MRQLYRLSKETSRYNPQTGKFDYFITLNQSVRSMASEFFTADKLPARFSGVDARDKRGHDEG